ncbi:MAG: cyclic nucleotide-binding domain-containing protein [Chloroflexi bacterium]|nr:cyclic nucleotide-binding domain-containing protein [Chloroflexota bacterium]
MVYRTNVSFISNFLREVDMFSGLSERNLDRIASLCEEYTFAPGEHLGMQDERGTRLYIMRDGEIEVTVGSQDTGVVVRTVRGRETFPIAVLMEPPILVTTTQAVTEVNAFVIPRVRLMELCELEPEIGMHIYRSSCGIIMNRYRYTLAMLSDSAGHPTRLNPVWRGAEV